MRKPWSLAKREQFTAVFRQGRPYSGRLVVVRVLSTGRETSRLGLVVGKKVGGAVQRNRAKRLIREAVSIRTLATGWDVVVIARPGLQSAKYRVVEQELRELLLKAGIARGGRVGGGCADTRLSEDDL